MKDKKTISEHSDWNRMKIMISLTWMPDLTHNSYLSTSTVDFAVYNSISGDFLIQDIALK
jgi:hypothetical protein